MRRAELIARLRRAGGSRLAGLSLGLFVVACGVHTIGVVPPGDAGAPADAVNTGVGQPAEAGQTSPVVDGRTTLAPNAAPWLRVVTPDGSLAQIQEAPLPPRDLCVTVADDGWAFFDPQTGAVTSMDLPLDGGAPPSPVIIGFSGEHVVHCDEQGLVQRSLSSGVVERSGVSCSGVALRGAQLFLRPRGDNQPGYFRAESFGAALNETIARHGSEHPMIGAHDGGLLLVDEAGRVGTRPLDISGALRMLSPPLLSGVHAAAVRGAELLVLTEGTTGLQVVEVYDWARGTSLRRVAPARPIRGLSCLGVRHRLVASRPPQMTGRCTSGMAQVRDARYGVSPEIHIISAESTRPDPALIVVRRAEPSILVLSARAAAAWRVQVEPGARLLRILLTGDAPARLEAPSGIPIDDYAALGRPLACSPTGWPADPSCDPRLLVTAVEQRIDRPVATVTTCERLEEAGLL